MHGGHGEHVGSGPGGAGPVGVVVKRSHRFGVEPDAVVTPDVLYDLATPSEKTPSAPGSRGFIAAVTRTTRPRPFGGAGL